MPKAQIMVVEDESIVALDIQNRLTSLGYAVSGIASSGEQAIRQATRTRPDLVLMDIRLEGKIDGIEAAEQIRARFDIPVVYLTAYADGATLQRAKITEPFGYLLKPPEGRELHTTIEMALYKHKMERRLRESEQWLTTTLRSIGDAVIATDAQGCVMFMNPVAEGLTGWKQEEALGKDSRDVFHIINRETRTPSESPVEQVLRDGSAICLRNQILLVAKDGIEIPIDDSAAPIRDNNGRISGVVWVFRDITERMQAEEALRESQQLLKRTFASLREAVFIIDADAAEIADCNPAASEIFGYSRQEVLGQTVDFLHVDQAALEEFRRRLYPAVKEKGFLDQLEFRMKRKDGTIFPTEHSVMPLEDEQGRRIGWVSVVRDITERVQAEESLRQHAAELQARNEELDAFAHTVAHDLENPLGVMVGYAEMLEEDYATIPEEEARSCLQVIARNGRKMGNIVDELLLLAQVRQAEVELEPLDMASIVTKAQWRLADMIEKYHAGIILPERWPVALGYSPWVEAVWVNYLSNAIRYGGEPPRVELGFSISDFGLGECSVERFPILDFSLAEETQSKIPNLKSKMVCFWVRDNGPGIAPEDQARLFTPFTQLSQIRAKGHGLGLSIVRRIVEKLGGQVGVESKVGHGSTFTFTLPGVAVEPAGERGGDGASR